MLVYDKREIGNKLLAIRKKLGLTQEEVAEISGISYRTYADIERGTVNMRIETALYICKALHITPNDIFTQENVTINAKQEEIFERLKQCTPREKETALNLLAVYLDSLT
ncbi:MAG: helix-turn-helix transcriptional regulator [Clostridia bacterium]|nr:helix-turn-helix transcriptional regulator [Clostridia bacterium]